MATTTINSNLQNLPTLEVWQRGKETLVSATFPNVPDFTCDSWCYESSVDFIDSRKLDVGILELRHRVREQPHIILITTVTPESGAIEFTAQAEIDQEKNGELPENLLVPNLCWQLKRAPAFASAPKSYPEFIKRCFIFTPKGMTFLDQTTRRKIPCRADNDARNNPPWVQMYRGIWQEIPEVVPELWSDYSPDRYVTTVIGAVSRDGKYLTALANDSATMMAQAWHDCMHNNPQWLPTDAPAAERIWRLKIYVMKNDPEVLLANVFQDFPDASKYLGSSNISTT